MKTNPENISHDPLIRTSYFRFYEELNDFLPQNERKRSFSYRFTGTPSVKNTIEAIGVPHAEVDLILINGESVGFDELIKGGERISVYPVFESIDITPVVHLRPKPLRVSRFIVDVNLGKLAQKLRLLGFDALFRNDYEDDEIVKISVREKRIILTRDKGVLKHSDATRGYWLRSDDPKKQLIEVIGRLNLQNSFRPFSRCSNCNGGLIAVNNKEELNLDQEILNTFHHFWKCVDCGNIYWKGSHYDKICNWVEQLKIVS